MRVEIQSLRRDKPATATRRFLMGRGQQENDFTYVLEINRLPVAPARFASQLHLGNLNTQERAPIRGQFAQ